MRWVPIVFVVCVLAASALILFARSSGEVTLVPLTPIAASSTEGDGIRIPPPAVTPPAATTVRIPRPSLLWGAYAGDSVASGSAFEKMVGFTMGARAVFVHWGNNKEFPSNIAADAKKKSQTLVIFWEAMDYDKDDTHQPAYSTTAIERGDWDSYISSFANEARLYGGPIILIPFEEMNGNWYPWSGTVNGNSSKSVIAGYRHIHDLFVSAPNVKFGWDVNEDSVPDTAGNSATAYYPGDDVVDYVGVDGFNDNNPWKSFNDIFSKPLSVVSAYGKPIFIFSFASAEGQRKAAWIRDALVAIHADERIVGWLWFNENKEKDWRVNSDTASLESFRGNLR